MLDALGLELVGTLCFVGLSLGPLETAQYSELLSPLSSPD